MKAKRVICGSGTRTLPAKTPGNGVHSPQETAHRLTLTGARKHKALHSLANDLAVKETNGPHATQHSLLMDPAFFLIRAETNQTTDKVALIARSLRPRGLQAVFGATVLATLSLHSYARGRGLPMQ